MPAPEDGRVPEQRPPARTLGVTGLALVLVAVLIVAAVWGLQRRLIYFPSGIAVPPVSGVLPGAREVRLHT
ncbi:MAG: hypothetical protein ACRDSN_24035, partial [Pseudonocardiaceae bacterium]